MFWLLIYLGLRVALLPIAPMPGWFFLEPLPLVWGLMMHRGDRALTLSLLIPACLVLDVVSGAAMLLIGLRVWLFAAHAIWKGVREQSPWESAICLAILQILPFTVSAEWLRVFQSAPLAIACLIQSSLWLLILRSLLPREASTFKSRATYLCLLVPISWILLLFFSYDWEQGLTPRLGQSSGLWIKLLAVVALISPILPAVYSPTKRKKPKRGPTRGATLTRFS